MQILKNISLKNYNTFGLDLKANLFISINNEKELDKALFSEELTPYKRFILGGGSNILLTQDYDGLIIKVSIPGINIIRNTGESVFVEAGAGVNWHDLVLFTLTHNLGGIENLSLIPGTVGAAPMQNIGAYGVELKEVFYSLKAVNTETRKSEIFYKDDCKFGYRTSVFKNELKNKYVITAVTIKLDKNPVLNLTYGALNNEVDKLNLKNITIQDVSNVVCRIRRSKLPDTNEFGNAGSFFKNPLVSETKFYEIKNICNDVVAFPSGNGLIKIPAGWMIEKAGWKGKRIGNAGSYMKQSLVLVNYGNALPEEILSLAAQIKNSVFEKFGVVLEKEVNII